MVFGNRTLALRDHVTFWVVTRVKATTNRMAASVDTIYCFAMLLKKFVLTRLTTQKVT